MQNKISKKGIDSDDLLYDEYEKMTLILDEYKNVMGCN